MENELEMNSNLLVEFLQKPSSEFTKADIISFIREKGIKMVQFYVSGRRRPSENIEFCY